MVLHCSRFFVCFVNLSLLYLGWILTLLYTNTGYENSENKRMAVGSGKQSQKDKCYGVSSQNLFWKYQHKSIWRKQQVSLHSADLVVQILMTGSTAAGPHKIPFSLVLLINMSLAKSIIVSVLTVFRYSNKHISMKFTLVYKGLSQPHANWDKHEQVEKQSILKTFTV